MLIISIFSDHIPGTTAPVLHADCVYARYCFKFVNYSRSYARKQNGVFLQTQCIQYRTFTLAHQQAASHTGNPKARTYTG